MLRLLKNAESNAEAKNLELEDLVIKSIVTQQAPVRPILTLTPWRLVTVVFLRKLVDAHTVLTVVSIPIKDTRPM